MSVDESGTHLVVVDRVQSVIKPKVIENNGRLIRTIGDGFLIGFDSAIDAVRCALDIQQELPKHNIGISRNQGIQLRIGINAGDVIIDDRDLYGHNVNIAARLEGVAEPGEIYVTRGVRDQLQGYPDLSFEDRGFRRLKNIDQPIRVFRVRRVEGDPGRPFPAHLVTWVQRFLVIKLVLRWRTAVVMMLVLGTAATVTVGAL